MANERASNNIFNNDIYVVPPCHAYLYSFINVFFRFSLCAMTHSYTLFISNSLKPVMINIYYTFLMKKNDKIDGR